jgi:L-lactate dehydrogenase complex protein LldG
MSARDDILSNLRRNLARSDLRFPPANPQPLTAEVRMTVTRVEVDEGRRAWAHQFGRELEKLHGSYEMVETPTEARMALFSRMLIWLEEEQASHKIKNPDTSHDREVLSWHPSQLPLPELEPAIHDMGFRLIVPVDMHSAEDREVARLARMGITGVDAAFASTGSVLMIAGPGKSRAASLLPLRHLMLIPLSQLYPTFENWMAEQRHQERLADLVRKNKQVTLISGPSKSADLEGNLTLGVHGPKQVHAILYDDQALENRDWTSDLGDTGDDFRAFGF